MEAAITGICLISALITPILREKPFSSALRLVWRVSPSWISRPKTYPAGLSRSSTRGMIPHPVPRSTTLSPFLMLANSDRRTASIENRYPVLYCMSLRRPSMNSSMDSSGERSVLWGMDGFTRIFLIKDQACQDLRIKIGGLSGHDKGIARHLFDLCYPCWIKQECHFINPGINKREGVPHIAGVMEDRLIIHVLPC